MLLLWNVQRDEKQTWKSWMSYIHGPGTSLKVFSKKKGEKAKRDP